MPSRTPPRNRLAKPLPPELRDRLRAAGVPPRKCTVVATALLADGGEVPEVVIEEGWIIAIGTGRLREDRFEQRIDLPLDRVADLRVDLVL